MKLRRIFSRLNEVIFDPIRRGHPEETLQQFKLWLNSENFYWGLKRDLSVDFAASSAKIPLIIRPVTEYDIEAIIHAQNVPEDERYQFARRLNFLHEGIKTCFVAATEAGEPAYIQWLFGPGDNDFLQANFRGLFPRLKPDEALLEYAFTLPDYRGFKIMPQAMDLIARRGAGIGAHYIITFVSQHNTAALKGCERAGFSPYIVVRDQWRFFRRTIDFLELAEGPPYPLKD